MHCKKCGCELQQEDVFCAECGTKVEAIEVNSEPESKVSSKKSPVKIIVAAVAIVIVAVAGILFMGDKPEDINLEAKDLGAIIYTDEKEQYYQDNLHVHGYLINDPTNPDRYALYSSDPEDSEDGVVFVFGEGVENTIGDSLGNGSELIVAGTLGHYSDSPSAAMLLAKSVEVVNKVEPIYNVGTVDELLANSGTYMNKMVCVVGQLDGVSDSAWIWDTEQQNPVRLEGVTGDVLANNNIDWFSATVTGRFVLNDYGEMVIEVEKVE